MANLSNDALDALQRGSRRTDGRIHSNGATDLESGKRAARIGAALSNLGLARWTFDETGHEVLQITDIGRRYVAQRRAA